MINIIIADKYQWIQFTNIYFLMRGRSCEQQNQDKKQPSEEIFELDEEKLCVQSNLKELLEKTIIQQSEETKLLTASQRFYRKYTWAAEIKQNCLGSDFQSVEMQLHYGNFATKIRVINLQILYQLNPQNLVSSGSFGRIQLCNFRDELIAVKLIRINQKKQALSAIQLAYKEFFLALMASQLGVGPKIVNLFGYQIVFLSNCALFGMQFCQRHQFNVSVMSNNSNSMKKNITKSVETLHALHIVHRDIKPENILWSSFFQKYVLIDFGLSLIVSEKKGQKTYTSFAGSLSYCSPQMQKCFTLSKSRQVDLYQNDLFALRKLNGFFLSFSSFENTQKEMGNLEKLCFNSVPTGNNTFLQCLVEITNFKNILFDLNTKEAYNCLVNCKYALKTMLHLCNKLVNSLKLNQQQNKWKEWSNQTRKKIIQQNFVTSQSDKLFLKYFQEPPSNNYFLFILPLSSSLQNQLKNVSVWANDQMWLSRVYLLLNYGKDQAIGQVSNFQMIFKMIINKIYGFLTQQDTNIFLKKVRKVLLFFSEKFSYFKNKEALQSLADLFFAIGDILQGVKIRMFVVTLIQDPLQYCLKNLSFYMYEQKDMNFHQSGVSFDYLFNIQRMVKSAEQLNPFSSILLQICDKFLTFECVDDVKQLNSMENILNSLDSLKNMLCQESGNDCIHVHNIILKFRSIFIFNINHYIYNNVLEPNYLQKLIQKIKELERFHPHQVEPSIHLMKNMYKFYLKLKLKQIQRFQKTRNFNQIKEYFLFSLEMSQNLFRRTENQFQMIFYQKAHFNFSLIMLSLRERAKLIQVFLNKNHFRSICFVLTDQVLSFEKYIILTQTLCKNQISSIQFSSYTKLKQEILAKLIQIIDQNIKNERERDQLRIFIDISVLVKFDYSQYEEQTLSTLQQIYKKIKKFSQNERNLTVYVRGSFIEQLIVIYKSEFFKKTTNIDKLQELIIKTTQIKNNFYELLIINDYFQSYIKILHKKQSKIEVQIISNAILFLIKQEKYQNKHAFSTYNLNNAIDYFVYIYDPRQFLIFIVRGDIKKNQFKELIGHYHGCYFFYKMMEKTFFSHKQITYIPLTYKFLYKIAQCLSRYRNETIINILKTYYQFFTVLHQKKSRKLLISERLCVRHNNQQKIKLEHSFQKIKKKLERWPDRARVNLKNKLIYFENQYLN